MAGFPPAARQEVYAIYPGLRVDPTGALGPPARPIVTRREAEAYSRAACGKDGAAPLGAARPAPAPANRAVRPLGLINILPLLALV